MDVAAGNGLAGGPVGVAPEADLVFVHLADRGTSGLASLGDSVRILEAVDFIARIAGQQPWVINLSVGRHGGPHDGCTLTEIALDFALSEARDRFIVQSTGNYFDKSIHASGRLKHGQVETLTLITNAADLTTNELEIWYGGEDEFLISVRSPIGAQTPWVRLGRNEDILENGRIVGRIYHRVRDPNNLDNHIDLFLYPWGSSGRWMVRLRAIRAHSGIYHAWLERDEACAHCQAHFIERDADRMYTTGTIANGRLPLVVGAYDSHSPARELALFSSSGPTRDGRVKPDLVAPGVQVLAARSAPRGCRSSPGMLARRDGTSFAAPHATGAVALCLQGARHPLASEEIRALLMRSAERRSQDGRPSSRFGWGYLDVDNVVIALSALGQDVTTSRAHRPVTLKQLDHDAADSQLRPSATHAVRVSLGPDQLYREIVHNETGPRSAWIDETFLVLARPGESPASSPEAGDVLVRVALGEPGFGHVALLSDSRLTPREALRKAGISPEREGPGFYVIVTEGGAFPHALPDRFARRVLDRAGRMPLGQVLLRLKPPPQKEGESPQLEQEEARAELGKPRPPPPITMHVRFEVYNRSTGRYDALPRGVPIDLMDYDPLGPNDVVATALTNSRGTASFSLTRAALRSESGEERPDLYFRVRPRGIRHANTVLPEEWSTKGWQAVDGSPGYYDSFAATAIGTAQAPVVFRIGVDYHARFEYTHGKRGTTELAPPGIVVYLIEDANVMQVRNTDAKGEVHGVAFNLNPGRDVAYALPFMMHDPRINLKSVRVSIGRWRTSQRDRDRRYYPSNRSSSLGRPSAPHVFPCTMGDRNVALYLLKVWRELSEFLFEITRGSPGAWDGIGDLVIDRGSISGFAYSWPKGNVNIPSSNHWDRGTIIHELAHQVMWQQANYSTLGVAYEALRGDLHLTHQPSLLSNPEHALIEGWAEFLEAVFEGRTSPPYAVGTVTTKSGASKRLGPPPANRGEAVEGAFANALSAVFDRVVAGPASAGSNRILESPNGNVVTGAPWIRDPGVRARFQELIWHPLRSMGPVDNPTSTTFIAHVRTVARARGTWHRIQRLIHPWNLGLRPPTVTAVNPARGPAAGGQTVNVSGSDFVDAATRVIFGQTSAGNVQVTDDGHLTAQAPPGKRGATSLTVATLGGTSSVSYTYV